MDCQTWHRGLRGLPLTWATTMDLMHRQATPVLEQWILGPQAYLPFRHWRALALIATLLVLGWMIRRDLALDATAAVAVCWAATYAYQIAYNRTVVLYMDADGVWIYRGVLPWRRGVYGVKWRDIESIVYNQSLANWLTRSFPVVVIERFTQHGEIRLDHVWHGDRAVTAMNQKLMQIVRDAPRQGAVAGKQSGGSEP